MPKSNDVEGYFCKDCKHSFRNFWKYGSLHLICRKSVSYDVVNQVTGKREISYTSCSVAREHTFVVDPNSCGPNGKHWIPKHKKDIFRLIKKDIQND